MKRWISDLIFLLKNMPLRKKVFLVGVLFISISLPAVLFVTQQQQEIRQRASETEPEVSLYFTNTGSRAQITSISIAPDQQQASLDLYLNTGSQLVNGFDLWIKAGSGLKFASTDPYVDRTNREIFDTLLPNDEAIVDYLNNRLHFAKVVSDVSKITDLRGEFHLATIKFDVDATAGQAFSGNITFETTPSNNTLITSPFQEAPLSAVLPTLSYSTQITGTPPPGSLTCSQGFSDNFGAQIVNSSRWEQFVNKEGITIAQNNGKLVITTPDQEQDTTGKITTKQSYQGDFAAEVDLDSLNANNENRGSIEFAFSDAVSIKARVSRYSSDGTETLHGVVGGIVSEVQLPAETGKVTAKIARTGNKIETFYKTTGGYQLLASEEDEQFGNEGTFELYSNSLSLDFPPVTAVYDNFSLGCAPSAPTGEAQLAFTLALPEILCIPGPTVGICLEGSTEPNPSTQSRPFSFRIFDKDNNPITPEQTGTIDFDTSNGSLRIFKKTVNATGITSGNYIIKVRILTPGYLWKRIGGFHTITLGQINTMPQETLVPGDINGDNAINTVDYSILVSCYQNRSDCGDNKRKADLNDNDKVDDNDVLLFIKYYSVQTGD